MSKMASSCRRCRSVNPTAILIQVERGAFTASGRVLYKPEFVRLFFFETHMRAL